MKTNARKILSITIGIVVVLLVLIVLISALTSAPFKATKKIVVDKKTFKVKVAETQNEKEVGLSQVKSLPTDYGMLFPFEQDGFYAFWMRDMKFPIDIIYINNNKIVKIFSNVPAPKDPSSPLPVYVPTAPADTVLEIKAGLSDRYKIKEGDILTLTNI